MKVYEALARFLSEQQSGPIFGLVGDANLYLIESFTSKFGGRFYGAANEAGAVLMGLGYANVTGGVGLVSVTHGPAVTNTLTGLIEGVKGRIPIVLLAGDTVASERENLQNVSQRDLLVATGAGFEQICSAQTALADLARALRRAHVERRPIALNMPTDLMHADVDYPDKEWVIAPSVGQVVPDDDAVMEAVAMLAAGRRPIILAGRGAASDEDRVALLALAERLEAPLATTLKAKGLFAGVEGNLGIFGTLSAPGAAEAILSSDCVIAFGAGLNMFTTAQGGYVKGKRVIQISRDANDIGRGHVPDLAIIGSPESVVARLIHWLDEAEIPPSGFRSEFLGTNPAQYPTAPDKGGSLPFVNVLHRLNDLLPADRTLVVDTGRFMLKTLQIMEAASPHRFVQTASFGSIGLGVGHALGAAQAAPGRPVVVVAGDGGFMLGGLGEFHSALRHGTDMIVVVCNDGSYGAEHVQMKDKPMDKGLVMFNWPDLAPVAEALGGRGATIRTMSDLEKLPEILASRDRPVLIDIKLDPDTMPFY